MRLFFGSLAPLALVMLVIGCNTVDPSECWPNTSGGFGGAGTIPIGAAVGATSGDFISPPPRGPLDYDEAPNPCIVTQSPCNEKCLTDYEAEAIKCGKMEADDARKTCQDAAHTHYNTCRENCQEAQESQCRKRCAEQAEACEAECRKLPEDDKDARRKCWEGCNNARAECIRKCKK